MHNHEEKLRQVREGMASEGELEKLVRLFKVFGDKTRMKILYSLFESELCVCAIGDLLNMSPSAISHQLKSLKDADLVGNRREGKTIYYFLADDHVRTIIAQGYSHITEER